MESIFWKRKIKNNQFQNPLLQNYKHTQSLIDLLKLDKNKVFSIILFSALSKLKFTIDNVLQPMSLIPFIKKYRTEIYTKKEMLEIKDNIYNIRLDRNYKTDRQHIENLNNRFNNKNESNSGIAFIIAILIFIIIGLLILINFPNNKNIEKQ